MQIPRRLVPLAFAAVSILYPIIAVLTVRLFGPGVTVAALCAILVARIALPGFDPVPAPMTVGLIVVVAAITLLAAFDRTLSVRMYPVLMNLAMLVSFGATLVSPPSMIERFARITEPDLPPRGVSYTRKVTVVWVAFFLLNGSVALWTVFSAGWKTWGFYNGFLAYVLAGLLLGGEYVVRQRVRAAGP